MGIVRVLDEPVPGEPLPRRAPEVVHDLVNGSAQSAAAGRTRLLDIYGTSPEKVVVIPHGSADNRVAVAPREASHPPMALPWGLLGPGKGIEHAIARSHDGAVA